jgi:pimeloyl-ACP methyl ester carboxylesterase
MKRVVILGCDEVVGVELAAQLLRSGSDRVVWIVGEAEDRVQKALSDLVVESAEQLLHEPSHGPEESDGRSRLSIVCVPPHALPSAGVNEEIDLEADDVWCLDEWDAALRSVVRAGPVMDSASLLGCLKTRMINHVRSIYHADVRPRPDDIKNSCATRGIVYRVFRLGMIVGDRYARADSGGCSILTLLHALDEVTAEVEERSSEFFDFFALRLLALPDSTWNLVPVRPAVRLMLELAAGEAAEGGGYYVVSPEDTPLGDFCTCVSECTGVSLLATDDAKTLNAIDRLLESCLERIRPAKCDCLIPDEMRSLASRAAGDHNLRLVAGEELLRNTVASIRRRQLDARADRMRRVAQLAPALERNVIVRPTGKLVYFSTGGQGPPLVILNALGQSLDYWHRLIDQFAGRYRVLLWEARGLEPESPPLRLVDHVEDVKAILDAERLEVCYLVGWCTGPQLAVEFYRRFPQAVLRMAFLNTACKVPERLDLETPYGLNLNTLCESLHTHPALAASVRNSLSSPLENGIDLAAADGHQAAVEVLSLTNVHLRSKVLTPFRTVEATLKYAAQMLDLGSTETFAPPLEIAVPVLVVGCEYDKVAMAAKSTEIANRLPSATHVELPGATHYAFYDRPARVAKLLIGFFPSGNPRPSAPARDAW